MPRFRKKHSSSTRPTHNLPPASTPQIVTEPIEQDLTTTNPQVEDRKALAASTSATPLPIASPPGDSADTTLDEPGSSKESHWGTAYEAAKIAIDIANASSDMFLPLKAVVGALSVLIKNYDQTADNADQIREIEGRVQSLKKVLESPVSDRDNEEKERREALRKKLDGIVAKLRPLSERHGIVKFLKNSGHAKTLSSSVRDLDIAVMDYQTSIQQNTYENTKRIGEDTKNIYESTKDIGEATKNVYQNTKRIGEDVQSVYQSTKKISEDAQNIYRNTTKIDEDIQNIIEAADLELLGKLDPVHDAGYRAGHHEACLPGTRESVLDGIMRWAKNPQDRHVFWLNGLAGTGKSTIAQTFSEMIAEAGTLGASFFCSRDYLDRKELKNIFPTLAYQLACRYPAFRNKIIRVIKQDPSVARNSLISQLKDLIMDPLSSTNISCTIVVDALDECVDDQPASALLSVLGRHVKDLISVKFFITGRPEPRIRTGFRLPLLEQITQIFLLHEVELSDVNEDIRLYLREKLTAVAKQRSDLDVSDPWPCDEDLTTLTKKSSGLFIFASTLTRFIESEHHEPVERLQLIITSQESTIHEGRAGIDPLYTHLLVHAFSGLKETTVFTNFRRVLGTVILAFNPLSRQQIAEIVGISARLITTTLRHLHSVLLIPNEDSKEIRVFHKSFPDFLQNPSRCSDPRFLVDTSTHHGDIALGCLELLKKLEPNPCNLPDFVMNRDVPNLPQLLEDKVGSAARYACDYWAMHVRSSPMTSDYALRLIASITEFLKAKGIQWIEVMSLENRLESVVHSIHDLSDWLRRVDVPTSDPVQHLAEDYLRFMKHFFPLIQQSALHIYHSALPLSPGSSVFHSMIIQDKTLIAKFFGCPETWGPILQTIQSGSKLFTSMDTFGHCIAVVCSDGVVRIYDIVTGSLRLSLKPNDPVEVVRGSPDGSTLFCASHQNLITSWDIQTGGLIDTFTIINTFTLIPGRVNNMTVSLKGHYLACGFSTGLVNVWKGTNDEKAFTTLAFPLIALCWLDPEEQLMIAKRGEMHIWDVVAGTVLRSFSMQLPTMHMVYSQEFNRLAIVSPSTRSIQTMDPRTGESSGWHASPGNPHCVAFSRTAEKLVCGGMQAGGLEVLDLTTWHSRCFQYPSVVGFVSCLQNETVAVGSVESGIQLLSLDSAYAPLPQSTLALDVYSSDQGRIIAIPATDYRSIQLLETSTMTELFTFSIQGDRSGRLITLLAASLENRVACFYHMWSLKLCKFDGYHQKSSRNVDKQPLGCAISPTGTRVVTLHESTARKLSICVWNAGRESLQLQAELLVGRLNPSPSHITFDSETRFYSHHNEYRIPYDLHSSPTRTTTRHKIIRCEQQPWTVEPNERELEVDGSREWVISGSERVFWVPPGYFKSDGTGYCWVGPNTLAMVGEDKVFRALTFRSQERRS